MSKKNINRINTPLRDALDSTVIGIVLTAASYLFSVALGWTTIRGLNWIEVFAVLTSYSCTYLCVRERRLNYPIGAISSAAYAYVFLQSHLLSSAMLNIYLVPTLVYGWIRWRKDADTRPVTKISLKWLPAYAAISVVGYGGAALLSQRLGGAMAWTDSVILAGTILAQFLMDNKKLENWMVWGVVNIFAIYTYFKGDLALVAVQYIFFLANTAYGYIIWTRSKNHEDSIRLDDGYAPDNGALSTGAIR
jgi:nicotinamide mononucleotide transporter